jgi:uncharacterized membrane protein YhaH (DUF805 family)
VLLQAFGIMLALGERFSYLYFAAMAPTYFTTPITQKDILIGITNAVFTQVYDNAAIFLLTAGVVAVGLIWQAIGILLYRTRFPRWLGWLVLAEGIVYLLQPTQPFDLLVRFLALLVSVVVAQNVMRNT